MPPTKRNLVALGAALSRGRSCYGVTLRELALLMGVSPSYLSRVENGRERPSERILRGYSDHFRLDLDEMSCLASIIPKDIQKHLVKSPMALRMVRDSMVFGG